MQYDDVPVSDAGFSLSLLKSFAYVDLKKHRFIAFDCFAFVKENKP